MFKKNIVLGVLTLVATACGSNGTNVGTVNGVSFDVKDTVSSTYTVENSDGTYYAATTILADFANVCSNLGSSSVPAGHSLVVTVLDTNTVVTANYAFSSTTEATGARVFLVDSDGPYQATSGSVTITSIGSDGSLTGTFDATFPSGHAAGSFDGTACGDVSGVGTL